MKLFLKISLVMIFRCTLSHSLFCLLLDYLVNQVIASTNNFNLVEYANKHNSEKFSFFIFSFFYPILYGLNIVPMQANFKKIFIT